MSLDCVRDIEELFENNAINSFAKEYLGKMCESGLDLALWEEAIRDMLLATSLGVSSDEDFKLFFYIDHFAEDLVDEIFGVALSEQEEDSLKKYMFELRNDMDFNNLVSFRVAILRWLKAHNKLDKSAREYHTRSLGGAPYYLKRYNMERWGRLATDINKAIVFGINKSSAIQDAAHRIDDNIERLDFLAWYSFKFGNSKHLYDINKNIQQNSEADMTKNKISGKFAGIYEDASQYYVPKEVFKGSASQTEHEKPMTQYDVAMAAKEEEDKRLKAEELEFARVKFLSRTFSIDKLLQQHHNMLGSEQIDIVEDALNSLRKQIRKLNSVTTMKDYIIRTSGVIKQAGFIVGGEALHNIGEPLVKKAGSINTHELNHVIDKLTDISTFLKQRAIVRDLAEADLELYDMDLASIFPEVTEAQAKLIDAFTYASNKIDDIIPKIRGAAESSNQGKVPRRPDKDKKPHQENDNKEDRIPLTFPKDKDLDQVHKEPEKDFLPSKPKLDLDMKNLLPEEKKPFREPGDLPKAPSIPKEEKAPKPEALVNLEKALKE